jgi:hypothetical protein
MHSVNKPSVTKKRPKSVTPRQVKPNLCSHQFAHLETRKKEDIVADEKGNPQYYYQRIDIFYCQKCLEYKTKMLKEISQKPPNWF